MTKVPSAHTAGHTPRPVVWVLGSLSLAILLIGAWVLRALHDGLSPHDSKPHGAETRSAVQAAEQTAHALEQADRDGTLTELEARSAVAGGGVLTRLRLEEDSGRLTVAFPYTAESRSTGATLHRYVCVYFLVLTGHGVDTDYSGGCTAHPQPFTGTATPES
jgi:hypothetical protein